MLSIIEFLHNFGSCASAPAFDKAKAIVSDKFCKMSNSKYTKKIEIEI